MAVTKEEIIEALKEMPALELSQLVKDLEDVFGVSAAAPVAMVGAVAAGGDEGGAAEEEQTAFDVVLEGAGDAKIPVIKVVREITGLGLKEAKALVDGAPAKVLEGVSKDDAEAAKAKLEAEGAAISIK